MLSNEGGLGIVEKLDVYKYMESEKIPAMSSLRKILLVVIAFLAPMVLVVTMILLVGVFLIMKYLGPGEIISQWLLVGLLILGLFGIMSLPRIILRKMRAYPSDTEIVIGFIVSLIIFFILFFNMGRISN